MQGAKAARPPRRFPGPDVLVSVLVCALALLYFYRAHLWYGPGLYTGDRFDPVIQAARLEHWYGVLRGWYRWRDPIFFYPYPHTLGYNDGYVLYGLIYSGFRHLGASQLAAMEFTVAVVRAVGFFSAWVLLRRYFRLSLWATALGAMLVTCANAFYVTGHTQLATVAFAPLLGCLIARIHELLAAERRGAAAAWGAALGLMLAAWAMTAFYTFWFTGLFALIALACAALIDRTAFAGLAGDFMRERRWRALLPGAAVFALGLVPFALTYGPTARSTGMHRLADVYQYLPRPIDLINVGAGNLVWGGLASWSVGELARGFTPIMLATLAIALMAAFRQSGRPHDQPTLVYKSLLVAIFVGVLLEVQVGGMTLWAFVYHTVPGARGLRVVARLQLVLVTFGSILVAVALERLVGRRTAARAGWRPLAAALVGVVILVEQHNLRPTAGLRPADVAILRRPPAAAPHECRVFYTVNPKVEPANSEMQRRYYIHAVEAMLYATSSGLPTALGVDSFLPPGWDLSDPLGGSYETRVYDYAQRHGHVDGLCVLDLASSTWRRITARPLPDAPAQPLSAGETVGFGSGARGRDMLSTGWWPPDDWGAWALGTRSELTFRLDAASLAGRDARLRLSMWSVLPDTMTSKAVRVSLAGRPLAELALAGTRGEQAICVPAAEIPADGVIRLTFQADRSYSPRELGRGRDPRQLDFALETLSLEPGSCRNPVPNSGAPG